MSGHTKGPWKTDFKRHASLDAGSHVHLLTDSEGYNIGLLSSWVNDPDTAAEAIANANLIAAAPELLEAAEKVIEINRQHANHQYGDAEKAESWACVTILRAAIAKAKGQPL